MALIGRGDAVWKVRASFIHISSNHPPTTHSAAVSGPVLFQPRGLHILMASEARRPWDSPIRPLPILHTTTHGFDVSISHIGGPGDLGNVSRHIFSGFPSRF